MTEKKAKPNATGTPRADKTRPSATPSKASPKPPTRAKPAKASPQPVATQSIESAGIKPADWREQTLNRMRTLILEADPAMTEEQKWKKPSNGMTGVPAWSHHGIVCTGETYAKVVKLTFARGAGLPDPTGLFNSSLEGNTRRAIDIREGETIDAKAFQTLILAAVDLNATPAKKAGPRARDTTPVKLLAGGNPQIAKADGDSPVRAYIAAMPGWKQEIGNRLDALIASHVPNVKKAVKWNSPFYGIDGQGWIVSFHVFTRYVKVTFFHGALLDPVPPGGTGKDARWIDIREDDLDEKLMAAWLKQAAVLPGWLT